jgi:CelD/BcsL family acetyltransferase involved in cellulose biosynthesis
MGALSIEIVRTAAALESLAGDWWTLWSRLPHTTPFQSPAWLIPWWTAFAPGQLASIAVRDDGELVGLAPMYVETGAHSRRLLPLGLGITDYCDVLVDPACEPAAAVLGDALAHATSWDVCEFAALMRDACALQLPAADSLVSSIEDADDAPVLALPPSLDGLRHVVPHVRLRQVHRARNAAAHRGEVAVIQADVHNARALLETLIRLHSARWQQCDQPGVFGDRRVAAFHLAALPRLMAAGLVHLTALTIGANVAAVYYGFLDQDRAYAYLQGYDPDFSRESPGLLVVASAIEQAIAAGAREFHFLRGGERYKFEWGADHRRTLVRTLTRAHAHAAS